MSTSRATRWAGLILILALACGCGTTRSSHTTRTGTEQLVLTQAWDEALRQIDFHELAGVPVFLETSSIAAADQGWIVSSLRQRLLEHGALLRAKAEEAQWIVEARVGAYGTDDSHFLIGVPQVTVPQVVPGVPSGTIPEMPLVKKTHQKGVAKLALFAYERTSGRLVWTSGTSQATANAKDVYLGGMGPLQSGTVRRGTEFMDMALPIPSAQAAPLPEAATTGKRRPPEAAGPPLSAANRETKAP